MNKDIIQPIIDLHTCIQGEGSLIGVPHILIRLAGCNLRCAFKNSLCDTPYSSWQSEKGKYTLKDVESLMKEQYQIIHVMITGGEPTIHPELLQELIQMCHEREKIVTLETNGTIPWQDVLKPGISPDLVSISPKLKNSIPVSAPGKWYETHKSRRENIPAIASWIAHSEKNQLKYVVSTEDDIEELQAQLCKIVDCLINKEDVEIPKLRVFLMPEGDTEEIIAEKRQWLVQRCIELGYSYTDRLHIIIYGTKREA